MSISLPSKEIYIVDVPEVDVFEGKFQYNFFVPDESVSETGGVPISILQRNSSQVDSSFIQYSTTRAPRFVSFKWKLPRLADPGNYVSELSQRNAKFVTNSQNGSLIKKNLDKIVTEDQFSTENFVAVNFHDGEIDDKLFYFVSGSYAIHTLNEPASSNISSYKSAQKLSLLTTDDVKPQFLYRALGNQTLGSGVRFFNNDGSRIFNSYFRDLKSVSINMQFNGKLLHDILNRVAKTPTSPFTTDLQSILGYAKKLKTQSVQNASVQISEEEYKTFAPYIDLTVANTSYHQDYRASEIVGYIIDKFEIQPDGTVVSLQPIVIDKPNISITADFRIKYNTVYAYSIRTVVLFTMPAIDNDTNEIAMVKMLVSSKPSSKVYVKTIETTAPPVPADLNFTWDYERVNPTTMQYDQQTGKPYQGTGQAGSLLVHWTFPPNAQRDIKRFQVFRRRDINEPFELIKEYNFDDSYIKFPDNEDPDPKLIEHLLSPATFFYDDDFQVGNHNQHNPYLNKFADHEISPWSSAYIYAIASVDAHGFTSGYSAQYLVWFDPYKNTLQKRLVSHSGAPKPYPNLYLNADTFVDTMKISGQNSKTLKIYFNPDFYYVYDDQNKITKVVTTKQDGGSYKLQFINTDNQKSAVTNIVIDDQIKSSQSTLSLQEAILNR